jgi:hypothetical protein
MCIYTRFQYLCLHEKLKLQKPCDKAVKDPQGILTCPDAPSVQTIDETPRTYGVGVCSSIHCAWNYSILPVGDYGDKSRFGDSTSFEDDTEIEDSLAAREDRIDRWFRLLTVDQQLDHFSTKYPIPDYERSIAGQAFLNFPFGAAAVGSWETLRWEELNPLYLTPAMLQWCVLNRLLPASVVDDRKSRTITPLKPIFGPFAVEGPHECPERHGICNSCGANIGNKVLKEATLAYRQDVALAELLDGDRAKGDLRGTAWDPHVDLKWDDGKGEYCRAPGTAHVANDALYPTISNPAFVSLTTPTVDTAAVFSGQNAPLADDTTQDDMDVDLDPRAGGMTWDQFVQSSPSDEYPWTPGSAPAWRESDFPCNNAFSTPPQEELAMSKFSLNSDFSRGTDFDTAASFDTGPKADIDYGQADTTQPLREWIEYLNISQLKGNNRLDSNVQEPHFASPDTIDDPMITDDSGGDSTSFNLNNPTNAFSTEKDTTDQTMNESYHYSPETLNLVNQMLRQAFTGGVPRPSYDHAANALFEGMLQYRRAGLC